MASAVAVALTSCAVEQTKKRTPRVGFMTAEASLDATKRFVEAFRAGLREHGYIEGQNVQLELRYAGGRPEDWNDFAAEFVGMPVDVIVAPATAAGQNAARRATQTIPIVMLMAQDPVASGLVVSLARPGGNVTGITNTLEAQAGKRLALLRELAPGIRRVGVIWDGNAGSASATSRAGAQDAARELNVEIVGLVVQPGSELAAALKPATGEAVDALLVGAAPGYITELRREIAAYALERRLPLAAAQADWGEAGALLAFGADQLENVRRLAYFVDRIVRGAKPGELPIEQPAKFETIVNQKTAMQLGITVPQSVLARATKVIQ